MSKVRVEIVPAQAAHIAPVAANMRAADRREVWASSRVSPQAALEYSLSKSGLANSVLLEGQAVGMLGVGDVNILAGVGAPWLLGTDAMMSVPKKQFLRLSRGVVALWREHYLLLSNYVDGRNKVSIRWLKWLGFEMQESVMMNGVEFWRFEMRGQE